MPTKYFEEEKIESIKLEDEVLDYYEFVECVFNHCVIENCKLRYCSFSGCTFLRCRVMNLEAEHSQMKYSQFIECNIAGVDWSYLLSGAKFAGPISKLSDCHLKYNTFSGMLLKKFDFSGSEILSSMFAQCDMTESNFQKCKLEKTEFLKCDIRKCDFREATGYQINIMENKLRGARFSYPDVMSLLSVLEIKID